MKMKMKMKMKLNMKWTYMWGNLNETTVFYSFLYAKHLFYF